MPNARNLQILRQLRRGRGISQSDAATFFFKGHSARNTISDWENGNEIPNAKHRDAFIRYLSEKLGLIDQEAFEKVWNVLCLEWEWLPLYPTEERAIFRSDTHKSTIRPVYELPNRQMEIQLDLRRWQSARGSIIAEEGMVLIENLEAAAYFRLPVLELTNLIIECSSLITECGDDPWIGIRVRGKDTKMEPYRILNIDIGYLIYLRASGSLEIHSDEKVIEEKKTTAKPIETWTDIKIEIQGSHMRVWVNDTQYISLEDTVFGGKGYTYLMIHKARAQVKALRVYEPGS